MSKPLIFCTVVEPRIHKNTQNTTKFSRYLIKYMSVQHIWNLSQLLGLFTCLKLTNLSWNFVTEICKQGPKTNRHRLCCEKLDTSHDVKGFAIGSFLERIVVERAMMTSVRKTLNTLVLSAQNRSICSETCPENNYKIGRFLPIAFWWSLPRKFPQVWPIFPWICPWNSREISHFFHDLSEALLCWIKFGTKVAQHLKQA